MRTVREWVCINGTLLPADEARISVFDSGFMQGVGLFETLRAYGGRVFRLDRHVQRLIRSARTLGWSTQPDEDALREHVERVLAALEFESARLRLTVTTGSLRPTEQDEAPLTIVATATGGGAYPPETYTRGVTVLASRFRQNAADPTTGHKTTSYFSRLASLRQAHACGAAEALWFTHDNRLAEGSISNVFLVRDRTLLTPALDTPVLPGITRAAVLELAERIGLEAAEATLSIEDLLAADEVLLTNSMIEIAPVVRVEREVIGAEKPGEVFRQLAEAYRALVHEECGHVA